MRLRNSLHLLSAIAAVSSVAACGGHRARHEDSYSTTTVVEWDSRPVDERYRREREAMEARHREEIAHARADEAADARERRQAAERADLEDRYRRAKEGHMKDLPPSNHDHDGDHQ
jgi:hypothetical protein